MVSSVPATVKRTTNTPHYVGESPTRDRPEGRMSRLLRVSLSFPLVLLRFLTNRWTLSGAEKGKRTMYVTGCKIVERG